MVWESFVTRDRPLPELSTAAEAALLDAEYKFRNRENRAEAAAERDLWFAELKEELESNGEKPFGTGFAANPSVD